MYHSYLNSCIGIIDIGANDQFINSIEKVDEPLANFKSNSLSDLAKKQLEEYFNKERKIFDLPLDLDHLGFKYDVLRALNTVPYGQTISYGQLSSLSGHPKASQAVGNAIHNNPYLIVIPCHRVIKADGSIGGFTLGEQTKRILLELESNNK